MFAGHDRRWTWRPCCRVEFAQSQTWRHRKPWATICACYLHYHLPFSPSLSPHTFLPAACWTAEVSKLSKAKRRRRMVGGREGGREEDGVLGGLWVTGQGLVPTSITTPFGNGHTNASMNQKLQFPVSWLISKHNCKQVHQILITSPRNSGFFSVGQSSEL